MAISREEVIADGDLVIRRMKDDETDYELVAGWRNLPHVRRFWDPDEPPMTVATVEEEYGPDTAPDAKSKACIVELGERPIGFVQFYKWSSYAEDAREVGIPFDDLSYSLDIFIGDPNHVGKGVGTRVVDLLSNYLLRDLGASSVTLTTEVENIAAQRSYEKAGFKKIKKVLDTDTYKGERVTSWLMVKDTGSPREQLRTSAPA